MTEKTYHVIIDQSTSGSKLLLVDKETVVKRYDKKHQQLYPQQGWVEHDPKEIVRNVSALFDQLFTETLLTPDQIESISITNQRETVVAWDLVTGEPLYNAIVWQCNRTADICEELIEKGFSEIVNQKTGLKIDPYFSGTKIKWLVDNVPSIKEKSLNNELAIGTIDSWLIWNLSKEKTFATEPSNASRTLLYDINKNSWDRDLAAIFGISCSALPEIRSSSDTFGYLLGIPIKGVMADSQAALYGQACHKAGSLKVTMGTGSSIMMQLEDNNSYRDERILTTIAWKTGERTSYALEGIIRSCADSLNWLEEELDLFQNVAEASNHVLEKGLANSVYFVPSLQGLGAPFWSKESAAMFVGMQRSTTKEDLLCAVLESIAFQVKAVIDCMEEVTAITIQDISIDGGVSHNQQLMQLIADLLGKEIKLSNVKELSAIGALKMAGYDIDFERNDRETVYPKENDRINQKYNQWKNVVQNCMTYF